MALLYNLARMTTATTGTGTITLGSAVAGLLSFATAGVTNGQTIAYSIYDGANSEMGTGVYTSAGTTLTRSVTTSTNANAAINLTGNAEVFITPRSADMLNPASNLSDVASATTSRVNLSAVGTVIPRSFTGSGTYTPSTGMLYCIIECVAGGGGGGGAALTAASSANAAGGGGGGGYARLIATAATIGASKAVTVGAAGAAGAVGNNAGTAGGDSSVGTICIAKGGSAGAGAASASNGAGGAGGIAGTGDLTFAGGNGSNGGVITSSTTTNSPISGVGGNSYFGYGGVIQPPGATGTTGTGYGAGGGGGTDFNNTGNRAGGPGTIGVVFITEFCTQ